jgi:hypothetical protein
LNDPEQGLPSSLQHDSPPHQQHPLDFANAELAAQDMLLGDAGDLFGPPAPDPETYPKR